MKRIQPILHAWIMLAAVAGGGILAPLAHRVAHASEQVTMAAHDSADHHHDDALSHHGQELQPRCPDAVDHDWTCTLCQGPTARAGVDRASIAPQLADAEVRADARHLEIGEPMASALARGPPEA